MKRILSTIALLIIAVYWIGGLALHVWTIALGFRIGGLFGGIAAFIAPFLSELVMIWIITNQVGWLNWYNLACAAEICLFLASIGFGILAEAGQEQSAN